LPENDQWGRRAETALAASALCAAHIVVACIPFAKWKGSLGLHSQTGPGEDPIDPQRIARQVERAAARLPFRTKCLPRAVAVSWLLRRRAIPHAVVIAVRPVEVRKQEDALHAWVEVGGGIKVIGDLPGAWIETLRLGTHAMLAGK